MSRPGVTLLCGDCREVLKTLADESVQMCVTSPPYWGLRDYGVDGQLGLEATPEEYVAHMVEVFREVRRVLRKDGTLWLNLGDSYSGSTTTGRNDAGRNFTGGGGNREGSGNPGRQGSHERDTGLKPKDLVGIPWRVAFALQADGWWLRSDIIWHKPNPMPESVTDRPTKAHEYLFLFAKSASYYYDAEAVKEPNSTDMQRRAALGYGRGPNGRVDGSRHDGDSLRGEDAKRIVANGRNRRSVWTIATRPYSGAHFATFPEALVEPCILAGTSERGCCPKCGAPWERVVERTPATSTKCPKTDSLYQAQGGNGAKRTGTIGMSGGGRIDGSVVSLGWRPGCACDAGEPVPCVVLDPFGGAGTVGVVAKRLGRDAVLIDLNPVYVEELARPRIERTQPCLEGIGG